jgi:hypothetical protein
VNTILDLQTLQPDDVDEAANEAAEGGVFVNQDSLESRHCGDSVWCPVFDPSDK